MDDPFLFLTGREGYPTASQSRADELGESAPAQRVGRSVYSKYCKMPDTFHYGLISSLNSRASR